MGNFSRSWALMRESFAVLRSDKQLMLFPVLSAISCLFVTALIATGGAFVVLPQIMATSAAGQQWQPIHSTPYMLALFAVYVANYFVIVFFNVALVGVANSRLMGGPWTFRDGMELAWNRKGTIFQWALVAATVGIILRNLEERMGLLGRIIMRFVGVAWTLACYFVVPVLAFEGLAPFSAIKRSARLFRDTWGERVAGGFSMGLVFMVLALPGFGFLIAAIMLGGKYGIVIGLALLVLYMMLLTVAGSPVQGLFNTAFSAYARFNEVPPAFSADRIT